MKRVFIPLLLLAFHVSAFSQQFSGVPVEMNHPKVDERLTAWQAFRIDADAIQEYVATHGSQQPIQLTLGAHQWELQLEINPIISPDFTVQFQNASGDITEATATVYPYRGYTLPYYGKVRLTFASNFMSGYINGQDGEYHIEPLWHTDPSYAKDIYLVYATSAVVKDNLDATCGNDIYADMLKEHVDEKLEEDGVAESGVACYQVDLAIAADASMLTKYGSVGAVQAHTIAVINDVEGDYAGVFNHTIEFNIVTQFVSAANPWGASANAGTYLANFRSWGNAGGFGVPFDLGEMWTNIDLAGSTIGIAYLSAVCTSNKYHVLQDFSSNSELLRCLTSHEIGHNFSCQHDNCPSGGTVFIMCPFVSTSTEWSPGSVASVNNFTNILINNGCLSLCTSGPPPSPAFSWEPNPACVNQSVQFSDQSSGNIITRLWTFPGGVPATSNQASPTVSWATPGVKNVTLTLNSGTGSQAVLSQQVTVIGQPTANFTTAVNGLTVNFTSTSNNATSYEWDFGDGFTSTEQNPVHTYGFGGFYTVILTVTGPCGTATRTILVNTAPSALFSASPTVGCVPMAVNFTNESSSNATSYLWSFPGGTPTASNQQNPLVIYQTPGVYTVTLTVSNVNGSDTYTIQNLVTAQTIPTSAFTHVANGNTVTFTNNSAGASTYLWNFGDGNISDQANPVHTYAVGGTYTVVLTTTNICGTSTSTSTVVLLAPPTAAFSATPTSGCGPLTVNFTNLSTNANAYSWSFPGGDPATSTAANVTVVYNTPGTYTATLTATNAAGPSTATQSINVLTVPNTSFSNTVNGTNVSFTNNSSGALSYNWNFGDGNVSTAANPTHTYAGDGVYQVVLTAQNACGASTFTQTVTIVTPPTANFNASVTNGCAPLTVQFNNTSSANATGFAWEFPGGNPATSTLQNPVVVYATPGVYSVILTVSNAAGNNTATQTNYINVNTTPTAGFSTSVNGYQSNFSNTSAGASSYAWNFGDGGSSTQANPSHTYAAAGVYTVTLTATNACGNQTSTQTVTIVEAPTASFSATPTVGCNTLTVQFSNTSAGNPTSLSWQFPGGNPATSTDPNPVVTYSAPGTYTVILTASNSAGTGTATQNNYISVGTAPAASFAATTNLNVASFSNASNGASSYNWNFGDGGTSTLANPTHTYANDGTYTVVLTAINDCGTATFTQTVTILTPPSANFTVANNNGCAPFTVQFNNTSSTNATQFNWQFPGGNPATSTETNPTVVYAQPGVYSVTLVASNAAGNSTVTQTNVITVGAAPNAGFLSVVNGATASFTNASAGATGYQWSFGDGGTSTNPNPSHLYASDGTYTVVLTAINACGTATFTQTVTIVTPPQASFTASGNIGCAPLTVTFNNTSSANATTFNWLFPGGNPATSTEANPVVSYEQPGVYSVVLTATNGAGSSAITQTDFVVAGTAPSANFLSSVNNQTEVSFTNTSVGGSSYLWDFGDGNGSQEESPVHTYATDGVYTVVLTVNNACGSATSTGTITIVTAPSANFTSANTNGCAPFSVTFENTSSANSVSWLWQFPGGNPASSTEANPTVVYPLAGVYPVSLTATNAAGSATEVKDNYITVGTVATALFSYQTGGLSAQFTNGSFNATSYLWNFGDGNTSTDIDPVHNYAAPGVYTVVLRAINACGEVVYTLDVTIEGTPPIAAFTAGDQPNGCAPLSVQFTDQSVGQPSAWLWQFQGGTPSSSTEQNPSVTYLTPGVYTVVLTVTNAFGTSSVTQNAAINVFAAPNANFNTASIAGGTVTFNNLSTNAVSYEWNFGDGSPVSTEINPVHTYTQTGTFVVTLSAINECGVAVFQNNVSVTVVSVQEQAWARNIALYPNPNRGAFVLEMSGQARPELSFELCNTLGQLIKRETGAFETGQLARSFDYGKLPSGMYTFRISDGVGSIVYKVTIAEQE